MEATTKPHSRAGRRSVGGSVPGWPPRAAISSRNRASKRPAPAEPGGCHRARPRPARARARAAARVPAQLRHGVRAPRAVHLGDVRAVRGAAAGGAERFRGRGGVPAAPRRHRAEARAAARSSCWPARAPPRCWSASRCWPGWPPPCSTRWNPYVAERLIIGQWALLIGYAGLPWVLRAGLALARDKTQVPNASRVTKAGPSYRPGPPADDRLGALAILPARSSAASPPWPSARWCLVPVTLAARNARAAGGGAGRARAGSLPWLIPSLLHTVYADPAWRGRVRVAGRHPVRHRRQPGHAGRDVERDRPCPRPTAAPGRDLAGRGAGRPGRPAVRVAPAARPRRWPGLTAAALAVAGDRVHRGDRAGPGPAPRRDRALARLRRPARRPAVHRAARAGRGDRIRARRGLVHAAQVVRN